MNFKRKKPKDRSARRTQLLSKWGKGATKSNKQFYLDRNNTKIHGI